MSDLTELPPPPTTIPVAPDGEPVLSFAQERLWFMDAYAPGTTAYTIPEAWRLRGPVESAALAAALNQVAQRHEPLRTRFPATEDGQPVACIDDLGTIALTTTNAESADAAGTLVDDFVTAPFDLATGPVARALLITIAPDEHVLALAVHHIAADGWSTELMLAEVLACLAGQPLPELPVRYRDFAAWQRAAPNTELDVAYWREQLDGVVPLELPIDRPRPPTPTYAGDAHEFSIEPTVLDEMRLLGRRHRATPYMVLLAAFAVLLGRRARQDDITIGSPTAGRAEPELDDLVGCFINMVTMRIDAAGDPSFVELLQRVRTTAGKAFAHQELPFERLVTELNVPREVSRSPLFQVVFSMQSYESDLPNHPTLTVTGDVAMSYRTTRFDLELHTAGDGEFLIVYNTALFTSESIARLGDHFRVLLQGIAADPDAPISSYELLTTAEREQRAHWNDTDADLGPDGCLHRPVEMQARRTPDHPALIHPGGSLTHGDLDRRAEHCAARLADSGVTRGDLVAVVMERGWEQVVAVLAINKAGAAYLPVDADLPERRRDELIARGGCAVALTQPSLHSRLSWPEELTVLAVTDDSGDSAPACPAEPADLAYVIFTSGSTGTPKGVMIEHRAALNTIRDINGRFRVGPDDRVFALSALSFDLSVYDVYGTLASGATLVMGPPAADKDPAAWAGTVRDQRITVWNSVPALMELLVEHAELEGTDLGSLRLVMMSGDWIPPTLPDRIRALAPDAEIISLGGATEGSIWSIYYPIGRVDPAWSSIPYGGPLTNQRFHILDRGGCDVPVGVPGELYIGGVGVATGYWKDPERTEAAFVTHPRTGARLYRTGDLGRYRADGVIEFLGRADAQVKIRGYRIELGEIEAHLTRHPDVAECVVTTYGTGSAAQLAAYVVAEAGQQPEPGRLRSHLTAALPAYMIPTSFVLLPSLPLTANGKVDRARLPAPETPAEAGAERVPPRTDLERAIHAVWAEVLDRSDIGIDDDFFNLGGHSLLAIMLIERLRRVVSGGATIAVMDLFSQPTIRRLAALIGGSVPTTRGLLHRLTPQRPAEPELSYLAVPYGGGGAMVYKPLADELPDTHALWSVGIPGHDPEGDQRRAPLVEIAARCVREVHEKVLGPIALYGHCAVGSALVVEIARQLEAAGRIPTAIYLGAIFPFASPGRGRWSELGRLTNPDTMRSDRSYANGLIGLGFDMTGLEPEQVRTIVHNTRWDTEAAEEYFTGLFGSSVTRLQAPIISVAGEHDSASEYYPERFREWHLLGATTAVVLIDEAGHFFQRDRAAELAEIVTTAHSVVETGESVEGDRWRLLDVSHADSPEASEEPRPSGRRFLTVAAGQLVSMSAAVSTGFALMIWLYLATGSLTQFAWSAVAALVPGLLVAPWAGAVVERVGRRASLLTADAGAGAVVLSLGLVQWAGILRTWQLYPFLAALSVAVAVQWLAWNSAVPQLIPKRYLGNAVGVIGWAGGASRLIVPAAAVGLLLLAGPSGVLVLGVSTYVVAIAGTLLVRFPPTMAGQVELAATEIEAGLRYSWRHPGLRGLSIFFVLLNALSASLLLAIPTLVLATGTLAELGWILAASGLGGVLGGLAIAAWGGPPRHRMRGVLLCSLLLAAFVLVTGLWADPLTIGVGVFGSTLSLTVLRGIHTAIIEIEVPERFQSRVFALDTVLGWAAMPIGIALVAACAGLVEPLLAPGGGLASTVGAVIGIGPGRGIALACLLIAVALALLAALASVLGLARLVDDDPESAPDDQPGLPGSDRRQSMSSERV